MDQVDRINGDEPRTRGNFLAWSGKGRSDEYGFTDVPELGMRDEPQGLDDDEYQRHVKGRARSHAEQLAALEQARLDQERRLLDFEQRIVKARDEARRKCIDVSSEFRLLEHMKQSGKKVRHLEQRLGAIERKVWRPLDQAA